MRFLTLILLFSVSRPALACDTAFTVGAFHQAMDEVNDQIGAYALGEASATLATTRANVLCLSEVVGRAELGRFARQMSIVYFFQQEEDASVRWAALQSDAAPGLKWTDRSLPQPSPYKEMLDWADPPDRFERTDVGFSLPKRSTLFMNGQPLSTPAALIDVPHLVQIIDKKGQVTQAFWQDGVAFPEFVLTKSEIKPVAVPSWYAPVSWPTVADASENIYGFPSEADLALIETIAASSQAAQDEAMARVKAIREANEAGEMPENIEKKPTPLPSTAPSSSAKSFSTPLILSAGLGVVAGLLYGGAALSSGGIQSAEGADLKVKARSRTNALVLGAGLSGAAAIGLGVSVALSTNTVSFGLKRSF